MAVGFRFLLGAAHGLDVGLVPAAYEETDNSSEEEPHSRYICVVRIRCKGYVIAMKIEFPCPYCKASGLLGIVPKARLRTCRNGAYMVACATHEMRSFFPSIEALSQAYYALEGRPYGAVTGPPDFDVQAEIKAPARRRKEAA